MTATGRADEFEAALERLTEPGRFREAERLVEQTAPQLQRVLASILESGDWFGDAHAAEIRRTVSADDARSREAAVRTLLAEEARIAMMVGVAVGWALAGELNEKTETPRED